MIKVRQSHHQDNNIIFDRLTKIPQPMYVKPSESPTIQLQLLNPQYGIRRAR